MGSHEKTNRYDIEQINEARRLSGLKEIRTKGRRCLRCGRKFVSEGDHNRLCDTCRKMSVSEFV